MAIALQAGAAYAPAQVTQYKWTGAADASWSNPANWEVDGAATQNAPMTIDDIAVFDKEQSYTVTLVEGVTNDQFIVSAGDVTFNLNDNLYYLTNVINICPGPGEIAGLSVTGGTLNLQRPSGADNKIILGAGDNSDAELTVKGGDTEFKSTTRAIVGSSSTSHGKMIVEDGATLSLAGIYAGHSGAGELIVRNGTVKSVIFAGSSGNGCGEVLFTGENAAWTGHQLSIGNAKESYGELTIDEGVHLKPSSAWLYVGGGNSARGEMTLRGAILGTVVSGGASSLKINLGIASDLSVGSAQPTGGGTGELNVLDNSFIRGYSHTSGNDCYAYIGPGSRLRIRDSKIEFGRTQSEPHSRNPFWFASGSFLTIELTSETESALADAPMIYSGAKKPGADTNVISEGAILEVVLTDSYAHIPGTTFEIFQYAGKLQGEFAGMRDGGDFYVDGNRFTMEYGAVDSAGVVAITAQAPLGTVLLIK